MHISASQLRRLVSETDELHREGMESFAVEQRELIEGDLRHSRRNFMATAGAGGLALSIGSALVPGTRLLAPAFAGVRGQADAPSVADLARFAASVEYAAVAAYQAAVGTGKLSQPVIDAGTAFAGHHQEHGDAFKAFVGSDVPANQAVLDAFGPQIGNAADEAAILEIAFSVENAASATYLFALGVLDDATAAGAVASILPVESQHAVVLGTVLGKDLTAPGFQPSFETTEGFLNPADWPIGA